MQHLQSAIVSVHDVTPSVLDEVIRIAAWLRRRRVGTITLLVVPGAAWTPHDIDKLRGLTCRGCELAGHGWNHRRGAVRSLRHRLHALVLSRNEAEHFGLGAGGCRALVRQCHAWFAEVGLPAPLLYVPPAWAWGPVRRSDLRALPFRLYEGLWEVYDAGAAKRLFLPVAGYMADTPLRIMLLRLSNAFNAALPAGPMRIAIHPADLHLPLSGDLERLLRRVERFTGYGELTA